MSRGGGDRRELRCADIQGALGQQSGWCSALGMHVPSLLWAERAPGAWGQQKRQSWARPAHVQRLDSATPRPCPSALRAPSLRQNSGDLSKQAARQMGQAQGLSSRRCRQHERERLAEF